MGKLQNSHMIEIDEYVGSVIEEKTTEEILCSVDLLYGNYWVGYVAEQLIDYKKEV
tara:strand:+ start:398 stop:565 length:168 start_codon:yes stop_codon:yes gene_type:complete